MYSKSQVCVLLNKLSGTLNYGLYVFHRLTEALWLGQDLPAAFGSAVILVVAHVVDKEIVAMCIWILKEESL